MREGREEVYTEFFFSFHSNQKVQKQATSFKGVYRLKKLCFEGTLEGVRVELNSRIFQ